MPLVAAGFDDLYNYTYDNLLNVAWQLWKIVFDMMRI